MKEIKKYFIQEHLERKVNHGGIGNADAEKIFLQLGCRPILFPAHFDFSFIGKVKRLIYLLVSLFSIPAGSVVFFQFPLYARMNTLLVNYLRKKANRHLVCFITDIDGLKDANSLLLEREIYLLKQFDYFIVHNHAMKEWLASQIKPKSVAEIEFFDFLAKPFSGNRKKLKQIVFAGNLSKSLFLEQLDQLQNSQDLLFNIYGPGVTTMMQAQKCASYKGSYEPYILPSLVEGSFGLVWDGNSITDNGGSIFDYMKYISHHKISLYILAGLPIIIYSEAGAAHLILKYKIGMLVKTLHDINEVMGQISERDYENMRTNMNILSGRISNGECLSDAVAKIQLDPNEGIR